MYKDYEKLRNERGFTDYRVAKETGVSTSTLTAWKNEEYTPKVDKLMKIAVLFNVPIETLIK